MAERDRPHIVVSAPPIAEPFRLASAGGGGDPRPFTGDRLQHGRRLIQEFEAAAGSQPPEAEGVYLTFVSFPGLDLALESLDPQNAGAQPELVVVRETMAGDEVVQWATVYIPDGRKQYFLDRLTRYVSSADRARPDHTVLVEGIQSIQRATIRELWTDPDELFPSSPTEAVWWEVWLRRRDGRERERLDAFAARNDLRTSAHYLGFGDRTVVLLRATLRQLAETFDALDDIAELRRPHEVASFLTELPAAEQQDWVDDLLQRVQAADVDAPVVCVLDTGVQDSHPLLSYSIAREDLHSVVDASPTRSRHPHGTEMAGLALYGDLHGALLSAGAVRLTHRLESVRIIPYDGENERDLYGAITARAVDRPEIQAADRSRVFMLAVTVPHQREGEQAPPERTQHHGRPTSWSATIDALSYGRAIDDTQPGFTYLDRNEPRRARLFIVSAGNIRDVSAADEHLDRSDLEPVEDPAHAWNAVTVGAYSRTDDMAGATPDFAGWVPIAPRGELAPVSRTSVLFDRAKWPFKPEVVAEGGNVARSPDGTAVDTPPNLAVLTTRFRQPGEGYFNIARDTSAATAQVAAIAAAIRAAYPELRPETVRALIVHSAEWTDAMRARFDADPSKSAVVNLLRRYGMGIPSADRALRSAADALTLVAEARIRPYERGEAGGSSKVREMNLHQLPWPDSELEQLGEARVKLRITLSYFVEPNPSSRGWTGRYVYPSHGLRFAVRRPEDSIDTFRQRINTRARVDGAPTRLDTEAGWLLGRNQQQAAGSLHTDIWTGTAAGLASKGAVAVYPVAGWWKSHRDDDRSEEGVDYALIISIDSPDVEIDLWTAVMQRIEAPIEVAT